MGGPLVTSSPTALKRWIALELRRLREEAGYDRATVGKRVGKASAAIAHTETGRNLPSASDVEVLLTWYGCPERVPFFRELLVAAKRGRDWWQHFDASAIPPWLELFLGLEAGAERISTYEAQLVYGPFQTRAYAEAVFRGGDRQVSESEIATKVEVRLARQDLITKESGAAHVWCILDEAALRRVVGGPDVMAVQLAHLVDMGELPNVDLQILPEMAGAHPGTEGSFTILDYPAEFEGDAGAAFVETRTRAIYYEQRDEIAEYRRVFERLQMRAARPEESRDLIRAAERRHR